MSKWSFTRYSEEIMDGIEKEFEVCSREVLLCELERFYSEPKDSEIRGFIKANLVEMLEKSGIEDYNLKSRKDMEKAIAKAPTYDEIYRKIFLKLYEISKDFKNPKDNMERLVKRLCDDEFKNDSVRLAILKQFIKYTDYNTGAVIDYILENVKDADKIEDKVKYVLEHIDESVFDNIDGDYKDADDVDGEVKEEAKEKTDVLSKMDKAVIGCKVLIDYFTPHLKNFNLYDLIKGIYAEISLTKKSDDKAKVVREYKESLEGFKTLLVYIKDAVELDEDTIEEFIECASLLCDCAEKDKNYEMKECEEIVEKYKAVLEKISLFSIVDSIKAGECDKFESEVFAVTECIRMHITKRNNKLSIDGESIEFPVVKCNKKAFELLAKADFVEKINIKENKQINNCFKTCYYNKDWSTRKKLEFIVDKYDEYILSTEYEEVFLNLLNDMAVKVIPKINDSCKKLFNKINNNRKKDTRDKYDTKKDWSLLRLADSMARGKFYTNGKTRNDLYMFAFAFNMKFTVFNYEEEEYLENVEGSYDKNYDIDKNLFHDYYNCNLLSYIYNKENNANNNVSEPTGEGINIKNFVEVIYLYYLNKNLSTRDKMKKAKSCIEKCKQKYKKAEHNIPEIKQTKMYFDTVNQILEMPEKALVEYICDNFYFDEENNYELPVMYANDEITATKNCKKIIKDIEGIGGDISYIRDDYGIGERIVGKKKSNEDNDPGKAEEAALKLVKDEMESMGIKDEKFTMLVMNMNKMLEEKMDFFNAPSIDSDKVQRTHLVTLASYYKMHESYKIKKKRSFGEICKDFCNYVNPILKESRYQEISSKNIFDVFTLLNLYRISGDI